LHAAFWTKLKPGSSHGILFRI